VPDVARLLLIVFGGVLLLVGVEEALVSLGIATTSGYGAAVAAGVAGAGLGLLRYGDRPRP
jgi:hypothetical protein